MPPTVRIRPYKDFLTPALHRRFALATAVLAAVCYVEAIWIGEWNSCIPLVMVSSGQGWYPNRSFLHMCIHDIHPSSSSITRRDSNIKIGLPHIYTVRTQIPNGSNSTLVSLFGMVFQ
ncbi:hypothetical protein EYC84_005771 [Monilinia fructicola]|uniref:Uncharacterized protein n=1 Tax=Monilinia fructicola TaxID=38448 RepID=A0A5M9K2B6_MONFR|nr:hypothetical protein EYC84_005771 [Monilinia fructicola]